MIQSSAGQFDMFKNEEYLAGRLRSHGVEGIFDGVTDAALRRERFRTAIINGHVDCVVLHKNAAGKTETYAQFFERLYGQPLIQKSPRVKKHENLQPST